MNSIRFTTTAVAIAWLAYNSCLARAEGRIDPAGIPGKLVICGGGALPDEIVERFAEYAGGKNGKLILIPTAGSDDAASKIDQLIEPWKKYQLASISVLHTRDRDQANTPEFVAGLREATAVWFGGGQQSRLAEAYLGTLVERELMNLLDRGGVIGGTSAGAAIQSRTMIEGGSPHPRIAVGFDFLPDSVVDQHFRQRSRKPRLMECLQKHPDKFGLGIDESTGVIVHGRRLEVIGRGKATIALPACVSRPVAEIELAEGDVSDLVMLRRAVRARSKNGGSCTPSGPPVVASGSLVLGGGGRMPDQVTSRFVDLAGGPDGLIVILPTASEVTKSSGAGDRRMFEKAGARNVVVLPQFVLAEVEAPEYLDTLARANGIWFGGGRQWRFLDAYGDTRVVEAFRDVLRRGGVIGGSSAGASIQAEYLVRGSPLRNTDMMVEGYESGFAFLPGTAVDQHFTQRSRRSDMDSLLSAYPKFLGIGIDESTAVIVRGSIAEVHGEHSAWFFDRSSDPSAEPVQVHDGESYDLVRRVGVLY